MDPIVSSSIASVALCIGMLLFLEIGRRIGLRHRREDPDGLDAGVGALNATVFSLFGLLMAFAYADASTRFDERRRLIVDEVNDTSTAWLRIALVQPAAQPELRDAFRRYVDTRIELYRDPLDRDVVRETLQRTEQAQAEVWGLAVAACTQPEGERARMMLIPSLNSMFDIATTRLSMTKMHPPVLVFVMLFVLALACALFAGVGMAAGKHRRWMHLIGFALLISATFYLISDIEYPRRGLVRIDSFDQMLQDLRASMD